MKSISVRERVVFQDLGCIDYQKAWDYQTQLQREVIDAKLAARRSGVEPAPGRRHYLLFCDHPPVYTLGKSGSAANLLLDSEQLRAQGFQYFKINRGGDITYHGPGQIVGYPIFDLDGFFTDVHRYVRYLEEAVIRTLAEYGIEAGREPGYTGVWIDGRPKRKICAIGVHLSRWVTMHGFAFNVCPQLDHFANIIPCGIQEADRDVTSMERELGRAIDVQEVKDRLKRHLATLFQFDFAA